MNYYIAVLKKYAVFSGRATRSEYWYFILFNFIISIILSIIDRAISSVSGTNLGTLGTIYYLVVLIPSLAVSVRRLHDVGKSGWMILINLIPLVGWIWFLVLTVTDSNPGENKYGPNPKGTVASQAPPTPPINQKIA